MQNIKFKIGDLSMEDVASLLKASQSARKLLKTNPLIRIFSGYTFRQSPVSGLPWMLPGQKTVGNNRV